MFAAIEACHQAVHAMGCPRVYTTVKINTRTDKDQTLEDKVASVQARQRLGEPELQNIPGLVALVWHHSSACTLATLSSSVWSLSVRVLIFTVV